MPVPLERTLVLLKPDTVVRGLVGEIIARFERASLKPIALKVMMVPRELALQHYPDSRTEFLKGMGGKTLQSYGEAGIDPKTELGTDDALEIGKMINKWNMDFLTSGPVVAMVLEGFQAISKVRKVTGFTIPLLAEPGTIRGDLSSDSPVTANAQGRAVKNMIHASGNPEEAAQEIALWFKEEELVSFKRADESTMYA